VSRLNIADLADIPLLKAVWKKRIRGRLKTTRFRDMELARDPLEYLGLERVLDSALSDLAQQLRDASYRPRAPEWIRTAKRVGLTRPLAFLSPRDQLVYKTLVALAENDLLQGSPAWTRLGRADPANEDDDASTLAESGWFRSWLRREGQLWVIDENHDWLVESDVSNFFPSVQVQDVCSFVQDNSRLGVGLIRLLEYMLQTFSPMAAYRPSRVGGLPQEGFDVSRVLAHLYLRPLDEQFDWEGQNQRYTRWVDDVVVGADSWDEALRIVQRIQQTLEAIGLYANSSKTRVIPSDAFRREYLKAENDWLGEFEDSIDSGTPDVGEFRRRLRRHHDRKDRPRGWTRVLRRYYTYSKRLRDTYLLEKWPSHIDESPDSARSIFDYLSTYRLTESRFGRLVVVLDRFGTVYEDIEILAHEYVSVAPSVDSVRINAQIADWALAIVEREADSRPRIAAAACVTLGKFGVDSHVDRLAALFPGWKRDTVLRTQATIILLGKGRIDIPTVTRLLGRSQLETIETLEFLIALASGEKQAIGMTFSALEPVQKQNPDRYIAKPRLLFLAPLLKAVAPRQWAAIAPRWQSALASNPPAIRDHVVERWLFSR
jgi:hypothetical protein